MKCKNCPDRKENDAVKQLEGDTEWFCTKKHSECEDIICLLRMLIWQLAATDEEDEELQP